MSDLVFYINNQKAPPPENWQSIEIEALFENADPSASIRTSTFEWLGTNAAILNKWKNDGVNGGFGIYEGLPLRIESCDGVVVFDGCIDMTSDETTFQCDIVKASCKETNRLQFLRDRASGIYFPDLYRQGKITKLDYVAIPYVISRIPDTEQVAILLVTFLEILKIVIDAITTIVDLVGSLIASTEDLTLIIAAGYVVIIIFYIFYAIFLTEVSIAVLLSLIDNIIQPLKYKFGMKVKDLFIKACDVMGLKFSSTILNLPDSPQYVIVPAKTSKLNAFSQDDGFFKLIFQGLTIKRKQYDDSLNTSNPDDMDNAHGYYDGTFAELISDLEDVFNVTDRASGQSGLSIRDGVLYFERWDFFKNQHPFVMPPQSSDAPFSDPKGTNASELSSNYEVIYKLDNSEFNTYDQYDGTSCQMTLLPKIVNNPVNSLLKGLTQRNLNFALAKRKTKLTGPEELLNIMLIPIKIFFGPMIAQMHTAINRTGAHGVVPTLVDVLFDQRIGAMLLSTDFISIPKLLVVEDKSNGEVARGVPVYYIHRDNQRADHLGYTDAYYLQKRFHSASWAIDTLNNTHNQYSKFKNKEIPLCCKDFSNIRLNNILLTYDQKPGRFTSLRWNPFNETATVDFRVKEKFTDNLKQSITIDGVTQ